MRKSILEVKGAQVLTKNEQILINGAWNSCCRSIFGQTPACYRQCQHH
jgi:hypothetical protein